eukprot:13516459-Alexandrium_andersonii.AAC.1
MKETSKRGKEEGKASNTTEDELSKTPVLQSYGNTTLHMRPSKHEANAVPNPIASGLVEPFSSTSAVHPARAGRLRL